MLQIIKTVLIDLLKDMGIADITPDVEISNVSEHGEYTTNVSMRLTKLLKKPPMAIAEELVGKLKNHPEIKKAGINTIDHVAPGFINFHISDDTLTDTLTTIKGKGDAYGKTTELSGKRIMVEYTDPNPFKELHIGHLYSNAVGESIARLLTFLGAEVKRADYFGDVGMHVAKTLWGLIQTLDQDKKTLSDIAALPLSDRIHYLGQAYARGSSVYESKEEKDKESIDEIKQINALIYVTAQEYMTKTFNFEKQVDYQKYAKEGKYTISQISALYKAGREWSLEYFKTIFSRLGTTFDYYYPESITGEYGMQMVQKNINTVFEESDGAIIFRGEKYGLHTRVFINALGLPTYEAKELGLAVKKYADFPFDTCINITGNEINEYFHVVLKALSCVEPELAAKIHHIGHGMVRLPEGKMSSRTGNVKTAEWFLDEVKNNVNNVLSENNFSGEDREDVAEKETIAAIKYSFLKVALPGNLTFNMDTSVSFDGDSGPYILYTYARCQSVVRKFDSNSVKTNEKVYPRNEVSREAIPTTMTLNEEEHAVARLVFLFPDVVSHAGTTYMPNILCSYLYDLSQAYGLFYAKHQILTDTTGKRLALTKAVAQVLSNGLSLLGIPTIERM